MSSCGPSSAELTSTADGAIQQTQTAEVTKTPTLTQTPMPTPTLTSTSTPIPTSTPLPLGGGGVIAFISMGQPAFYDVVTGNVSHINIKLPEGVDSRFGMKSVSVARNGTRLAFTQDRCPVPEPGQTFTFCRRELFAANVDGSNVVQVTRTSVDEDFPAVSPDGSRIAYVSNHDEIYVINADGSGNTRLTDIGGMDAFPAWSSDGKKIVFSSPLGGGYNQIHVMNVDRSGGIVQISNIKNTVSYYASWSLDGLKITFSAYNNKSEVSDLYIVDSNGANLINLTNGNFEHSGSSVWSPDGQYIAFNCGGHLCIIRSDGTDAIELIDVKVEGPGISWFMP